MMRFSRPVLALLAVLALALAACGGDDDDAGSDASGSATATATGGATGEGVALTGTDSLAFEPTELSASAGTVTIELACEGGVDHSFVIEGQQDDDPVVECDAGATASGSIELEAGTYTFYCDVAGHRTAGMEGTLEVSGA